MYNLYTSNLVDKSLISQLPENIQNHIMNYKNESDILRSLTGYLLLNDHIKKPYSISFDGKPRIDGIHFNISHDENKACLVISDSEIGVDIIRVKHLEDKLLEYIGILNMKDDYNKCMMWAMKEAAIKYEGSSIINIKKIDCSKYLFDIIDEDDYIIAVCYGRR